MIKQIYLHLKWNSSFGVIYFLYPTYHPVGLGGLNITYAKVEK